ESAQEAEEEGKENEAVAGEAQAEPGDAKNEEAGQDGNEAEETKEGKKPRFIVFVGMSASSPHSLEPPLTTAFPGNLPYSATAESIRAHFAPLHPTSVRCLNKRDDPTKCRGCAFVEFS